LAEFEITNIKSQITSADGSASNKITESYSFIGHWDLVFEFLSPTKLVPEFFNRGPIGDKLVICSLFFEICGLSALGVRK